MKIFEITQVAQSTPFDNDNNNFAADDVQEALEEVRNLITGKPRAIVTFAYNGSAGVGKWLEIFASISTDLVPFVMAEPGSVKALGLNNNGIATGTMTLYKNGSAIQTISLAASSSNTVTGLNFSLASLDEVSAQVTSGSFSKPVLFMSIEVDL